jgi:alkylation response protein AidB-like acyl-CoA dehydrogenase
VAKETIHLHGGVGFTWEHVSHLYFRRAHAAAGLFVPIGSARSQALEGHLPRALSC